MCFAHVRLLYCYEITFANIGLQVGNIDDSSPNMTTRLSSIVFEVQHLTQTDNNLFFQSIYKNQSFSPVSHCTLA